MFVFGVVKSESQTYDLIAKPALDLVLEPDSEILIRERATSLAAAYNSILDECRDSFADAEAVVLMHQDVEITGGDFFPLIRSHLSDPFIGLIGVLGAQKVRSLVYWRAEVQGYVEEAERTYGALDRRRGPIDVDAVDGMLLVLTPPAFTTLRFDEAVCPGFHGYDIDFSFAVRAAGLRVIVDSLPIVHHTKGGYGDRRAYIKASRSWRRKWLSDAPLQIKLASWNDELQVLSLRGRSAIGSYIRSLR